MKRASLIGSLFNWLSPAASARLSPRHSANARRGYDGAKHGRHTDGWSANNTSADTEIAASLATLRARSRDLTRNNAHASRAVSILVSNIVGDGIQARGQTGSDVGDRKLNDLWEEFHASCDADGQGNFDTLTALAVREMIEAGEVFVRRRRRRATDDLKVPLQLQVMEADHLDEMRIGTAPNGNQIVRGIEFDQLARRKGYWLFPDHPGDFTPLLKRSFMSSRVPAEQIVHLFRRQRVQQRGVPWSAPVMRALRDLDDWTQSELLRKKTEACVVGVVVGGDETDTAAGGPTITDSDGKIVESFEPAMFVYARGGKDIKFNQPSSTAGVSEWLRSQLKIIAAGYDIPYEALTGDLSQVNYSSYRAGMNEFRRMIAMLQWQVVIPVHCTPIWNWFVEAAWTAGLLPEAFYPVEWQPPKFEAINPKEDADADMVMMRQGTLTWPQAVMAQGRDPERQLQEIEDWNKKFDARGIKLDMDPRHTSKGGQAQVERKDGQQPVK
jgi:lambda family phage portal protein